MSCPHRPHAIIALLIGSVALTACDDLATTKPDGARDGPDNNDPEDEAETEAGGSAED
jgi:hypothetical protein